MNRCTGCYYSKHTALATFEPVLTCLHPIVRSPVGYPMTCSTARDAGGPCGQAGHLFMPKSGQPQPAHVFRQ